MTKQALITGITSQDGSYLAQFLLNKGYRVFGTYRKSATPDFWMLQYLNILKKMTLICADLSDFSAMLEAIKSCQPQEIYHLAALTFSGTAFEHAVDAGETTGLGVTRLLEAIMKIDPGIKFCQASSTEIYGEGGTKPLTEDTPFNPVNPYAVAKLYGQTG